MLQMIKSLEGPGKKKINACTILIFRPFLGAEN